MEYIITKEWRDIPATKQRANLLTYPTRLQAEHAAARLRVLFPGRVFEVESRPSGGSD